jgi:dGTPase
MDWNMKLRQQLEQHEEEWLCPQGARSSKSKGRLYKEAKSPLRTEYMRDRDRIIHCKSFRRLLHKTQVFISPLNDHFRTRATHTLEVMQIATDIASALRLNRDLTEAISLGHDLGHSPFGHIGEAILDSLYRDLVPHGSFRHAEFSLRIVDELEQRNTFSGLNLTWETRDGILNHSKGLRNLVDFSDLSNIPSTIEGQIVRIVDRIAFVSHDFDDSIHSGIFKWEDVPSDIYPLFSKGTSVVINYFASNLIKNFLYDERILLSNNELIMIESAKTFLTNHVYSHPSFLPVRAQISELIHELFQYFYNHPEAMEGFFIFSHPIEKQNKFQKIRVIIDYLAGMTDRFALSQYELLLQKRIPWKSNNI